jgi:uncharacterized membrane protein
MDEARVAVTDARTLALSDGVFAIALTLLVLSIHLPRHEQDLARELAERDGELLSWLLSYLVIAVMWVRHRAFFGEVERIDRGLTWLNFAYLGGVAFLPYPTQVLGSYGDRPAAIALYAVTLATVSAAGGLMVRNAARAGSLSAAGATRHGGDLPWWAGPVLLLLAIPASFAVGGWAPLIWLATPVAMRSRTAPRLDA